MRAVEKGYTTAVLEAGKRWPDEELPSTSWHLNKFMWQPDLELFGIQRIRYLNDVIVLSGSGAENLAVVVPADDAVAAAKGREANPSVPRQTLPHHASNI